MNDVRTSRRWVSGTVFWILLTAIVWVAATAVFWTGYTGEDDLFYARYAHLLHRPPIVWWEFRLPTILAIRSSFLVLGPTEFAATVPSLLASLAILGSVAWFVSWPRTLTWQSQGAVLLAALLPLDVAFRSYPSAPQVAAGLLAMGTVLLLKGGARGRVLGAAVLALAFLAYEVSIFYVGLLCLIALGFDRRRFGPAVGWCVGFAATLVLLECLAYWTLLGDPLARFKVSAGTTTNLTAGVDIGAGLAGWPFYLWPLQNLIFSKQFGFDLLLLFGTGVLAWPRLGLEQRILLATIAAVFLWLGYGTQVPWAYKPLYRQYHYYNSLALGIAALLPFTLAHALRGRMRFAQTVLAGSLIVHVLSLSLGGRWGAPVDVSRELLAYARQHPHTRFVTDVNTLNQMYVLNAFRLPDNVVCFNGSAVRDDLLLNKEPAETPRFRFSDVGIDAILVNREQADVRKFELDFSRYLAAQQGDRTVVAPVRYRLAFIPLLRFVEPRGFMVRSAGGEVVSTAPGEGADRAAYVIR